MILIVFLKILVMQKKFEQVEKKTIKQGTQYI